MKKKLSGKDKIFLLANLVFLTGLIGLRIACERSGPMGPIGVVYNVTPSVPIGIYQVDNEPLRHGKIVGFCAPANSTLDDWEKRGYWFHVKGKCNHQYPAFLKPVAALPGDRITLDVQGATVNGRYIVNSKPLTEDSKHRPFKPYPFGTYIVQPGQVWFISHYIPDSADSRYFGPVPFKAIVSPVHPLWTFPNRTIINPV